MYEAKYQKYITKNSARFAEADEIIAVSKPAFEAKSGAGVPLCYKDGTLYVDNEDNHTFVIGPTGCKKSRVLVYSTVASIIENGESAVITDPKGEIYRKTAGRATEKGAKVILLDFRKPARSAGWNPLSQIKRFENAGKHDEALQAVTDFAECIASRILAKTNDIYWGDTSKSFLQGVALMLMASLPDDYYNLKSFIPFCYDSNLEYVRNIVSNMDQTSTAAFCLRSVTDLVAANTRSCVFSTLLSALRPLVQNKALLDMLCRDSIDLSAIGKEQMLVYIIYPDEKDTLNFLVNMFITQCYETLVSAAHDYHDDRLPVRVNFVLDEFSNLVPISNFANRISESRSKNIRYFLIVQSYGQLKQKYGDYSETIISNCNNWICFSSKEMEFLSKISNICGMEIDYNGREHPLLSAFEMQHLRKEHQFSEVLIIKQGEYPYVTELPDFDYIDVSKKYGTSVKETEGAKGVIFHVTPEDWVNGIRTKKYKFPSFDEAS